MDLEAIGKSITDKKIAIGVVDHRNLQVERPEQVADLIRRALEAHPGRAAGDVERLRIRPRGDEPPHRVLQDGRRSCAARTSCAKSSGLPEAQSLASDSRYALVEDA